MTIDFTAVTRVFLFKSLWSVLSNPPAAMHVFAGLDSQGWKKVASYVGFTQEQVADLEKRTRYHPKSLPTALCRVLRVPDCGEEETEYTVRSLLNCAGVQRNFTVYNGKEVYYVSIRFCQLRLGIIGIVLCLWNLTCSPIYNWVRHNSCRHTVNKRKEVYYMWVSNRVLDLSAMNGYM